MLRILKPTFLWHLLYDMVVYKIFDYFFVVSVNSINVISRWLQNMTKICFFNTGVGRAHKEARRFGQMLKLDMKPRLHWVLGKLVLYDLSTTR